MLNKEYYLKRGLKNLTTLSRTSQGILNVSSSQNKKEKVIFSSKEKLKSITIKNFQGVLSYLYVNKSRQFSSKEELKVFIENLVKKITGGVLKEGTLYRDEDSPKYPYIQVSKLPRQIEKFYTSLFSRLNREDPFALAAWIIYNIDLEGHYFADGCGKTALALSSYVLMRKNKKLPNMKDRKDYYAHASVKGAGERLKCVSLRKWKRYYLSLFNRV